MGGLQVVPEVLFEFGRHGGVLDGDVDFVVECDRAVFEVAGANVRPVAVDGDHLSVELGLLVFEDPHAGSEQLLIRKSSRGRANGTTGSAWLCRGAGTGKPPSGGGFEGDLVAQCFELADVVTFFAFRADVIVVEIGAQVMETGLGIGQ